MIVTDNFVYIHTSRTAGTFLNKLIKENVPGARLIQYHGHLGDLPEEFSHLPVIGFVRNPWDWYVSMFADYRRKRQYIYQIVSERGSLDFQATVSRFLRLGDKSDQSKRLLDQLVKAAPTTINARNPARHHLPGLRSEHFANYPENIGYYSWLFQLMYESERTHRVHIGRFENLRDEMKRLFMIAGIKKSSGIDAYLNENEVMNSSRRPQDYAGGYSPELQQLVAEKDKYLIDQFSYDFSKGNKFPTAESIDHLGPVDVDGLIKRVMSIPESLWNSENEKKPNKYSNLNDTRHIMFRFVNGLDNVFDYHDFPLWDEWKDMLMPIMEQAAARLGYESYRFPRVMFARLPAGGEISPHSDVGASQYVHKIHVPLITNCKTVLQVGERAKHLPVGEMFEINNKAVHSVINGGEADRIHLIFECYNTDDYGRSG